MPTVDQASPTHVEFVLGELIACWDQAYEALAQGDLDRVDALLEVADEHMQKLRPDSAAPAELLREAASARGRLEHGMRSGLAALQEEMARARKGEKALRGYGKAQRVLPAAPGRLS